jgi:hypothetical protein
VDGEEGKRGSGRDFLGRGEAGESTFGMEGRFGVSGAGELITGRFGDEEDDDEAFWWLSGRCKAGDDTEACLCKGGTKLVKPANRNRVWGPSRS